MKLFTKKYQYVLGLTLGFLLLAGGTFAAPGDTIIPLIHPGNAPQPIAELHVGNSSLSGVGFDVAGLNALSSFAMPGSTLFSFGNFYVAGNTWLGDKDVDFKEEVSFGVTTSYPTESLNIDGTFLSSSLASGSTLNVCVAPSGILFTCDNGTPVPEWQTGAWGTCSGGTQTRTVECTESGSVVSDSNCLGTKPATSQSCASAGSCGSAHGIAVSSHPSSNVCSAGTYNNTADSSTTYDWQCTGLNGGSTPSCSAPKIISGSCASFPSTYSSQPAGSGNGCSAGTYTDTSDTSSNWNWQCTGLNGGSTASCSAARSNPVNGICQFYGSEYLTQPASNTATGCSVGTYQDDLDGPTTFYWNCIGSGGGLTGVCAADISQGPGLG